MKLIVGLGNPGKDYEGTRHNAGFMAVDHLVESWELDPFQPSEKHKAEITEGQIAGEKVILAKPQTFMNLSGQAVASIADFYKIPPQDVMVIYDEADLPFGTLRVSKGGSSAGHNGVKSLMAHVGDAFTRIRLGIKPVTPFPGALEDYVLGRLTGEEKTQLKDVIKKVPSAIKTLLKEGAEETMQRFN
ncbi:MAG: aminoacyl-tRNA hydrolase [Candidatus Peregrinibacteria bacterium]